MIYVALNSFTHDCSVLVKAYVSIISFLTCSHSHRPTNLSLSLSLSLSVLEKDKNSWSVKPVPIRTQYSFPFSVISLLSVAAEAEQPYLSSVIFFAWLCKVQTMFSFDNRIAIPC